jgi:hypothetical protein
MADLIRNIQALEAALKDAQREAQAHILEVGLIAALEVSREASERRDAI